MRALGLLLIAFSCFASDGNKPTFHYWIEGNIGFASLPELGSRPINYIGATVEVNGYPISYRQGHTQGSAGGFFYSGPSFETSIDEISLFFGKRKDFKKYSQIISIGLVHFDGYRYEEKPCADCWSVYEEKIPINIYGFGVEYQFFRRLWKRAGLGLSLNTNFNKKINYSSFTLDIKLGNVKHK